LFNGEAYFAADDGVNGTALWKSNGTAGGTVMIKSFAPFTNPRPGNLIAVGDVMIFSAFDETNGWAIWRTDGTNIGTTMVRDINPGKEKHNTLLFFTAMGELVYFSGDDGVHGREAWVTDGTANGTHMLLDIIPGPSGSLPKLFAPGDDNVLYFCAAGKLWKTNGTMLYTAVAADAEPLGDLVFIDEWIYYLGVSKDHGMELFKAKHEEFVTAIESKENAKVTLFPNPVANTLHIRSQLNEEVQVSIVDLLGVVRSSFIVPLDTTTPFDASQLSTGLYVARINGKQAYESIKFFKE
jgi:ELWxxDGT repeat protein